MNILFVDVFCPKPYDYNDLENNSMGGTEATMLRVAQKLALIHTVHVLQHNREEEKFDENVYFITLDSMFVKPDVIVLMRTAQHAFVYGTLFPDAKILVWMHDLCSEPYKEELDQLEVVHGIIYVSEFHKRQFEQMLKSYRLCIKLPKGHIIYNIVDRHEKEYVTGEHIRNRLLFASSPHKGLEQVMDKFKKLRQTSEGKDLELGILNPGYIELENIEERDGIKVYGTKSHKEFVDVLAKSALLFYPQTMFPETFGLVMAEANATYTFVVAHNFGAAREVLTDPKQAFDCSDDIRVIDKTLETLNRRDIQILGPKKEFMAVNVIEKWKELLNEP